MLAAGFIQSENINKFKGIHHQALMHHQIILSYNL